jgi:hypothetical protein
METIETHTRWLIAISVLSYWGSFMFILMTETVAVIQLSKQGVQTSVKDQVRIAKRALLLKNTKLVGK